MYIHKFLLLSRLIPDIFPENMNISLLALSNIFDILLFSPRARLINPPPGFYENVVINTRRCRFFSLYRISALSRRARNASTESFHLTSDSAGRKGRWTHILARAIEKKGKETRGRKGKNVNEPASVAPARAYTVEYSLTAWRRDARRRQ